MTREEAIKVLDAHIKNTAGGYTAYLAHGGETDSEMDDYLDAMYSALDALREQSKVVESDQFKWISVEDKLPEVGKRVLVYSFFDGMNVGWVQCDGRFTVKTPYPDRPTHWMPLPDAPEVEV